MPILFLLSILFQLLKFSFYVNKWKRLIISKHTAFWQATCQGKFVFGQQFVVICTASPSYKSEFFSFKSHILAKLYNPKNFFFDHNYGHLPSPSYKMFTRSWWRGLSYLLPKITASTKTAVFRTLSSSLITWLCTGLGLLHFVNRTINCQVPHCRSKNHQKGQFCSCVCCNVIMHVNIQLTGISFPFRFTPNFIRLGSWNIVMFVCFEQFKRFFSKISSEH